MGTDIAEANPRFNFDLTSSHLQGQRITDNHVGLGCNDHKLLRIVHCRKLTSTLLFQVGLCPLMFRPTRA
jgi:hypothetical protein